MPLLSVRPDCGSPHFPSYNLAKLYAPSHFLYISQSGHFLSHSRLQPDLVSWTSLVASGSWEVSGSMFIECNLNNLYGHRPFYTWPPVLHPALSFLVCFIQLQVEPCIPSLFPPLTWPCQMLEPSLLVISSNFSRCSIQGQSSQCGWLGIMRLLISIAIIAGSNC
jgi:hypothetical protein